MAEFLIWLVAALGALGGLVLGRFWGRVEGKRAGKREADAMRMKTRSGSWKRGARRSATGAVLILLSGCAATTVPGDAGCASYAEARLARPSLETVTEVPPAWADWIADLDDRMTGTFR